MNGLFSKGGVLGVELPDGLSRVAPIAERKQNPTALIGILAAKLACHAPDDSAVKWALEWLEEQK